MDLRDYLHKHRLSVKDFAKSLGVGRDHVQKIKHGYYSPGRFLAEKIEYVTNGEVTAEELLRISKENKERKRS